MARTALLPLLLAACTFSAGTVPKEQPKTYGYVMKNHEPIYVATDIYPRDEANIPLLGFYSSRERFQLVLDEFIKTGKPSLSDKVRLLQDSLDRNAIKTGMLVYHPVFTADKQNLKVVASRSHLSEDVVKYVDDLKAEGKEVDFVSAGSSLKFCLVAEGKAHVYPRLAPTMEWDTGAAHAVCLEAGKNVFVHNTKEPVNYNKENLLNPWFIVE